MTPLTSSPGYEGQPCFSPDGKQVAFVGTGDTNDNLDIYVQRIGDLWRDLRHALRTLRHAPAFTAVALLTPSVDTQNRQLIDTSKPAIN